MATRAELEGKDDAFLRMTAVGLMRELFGDACGDRYGYPPRSRMIRFILENQPQESGR